MVNSLLELQQILEKIGFNHHESRVYLELLERGEQSASLLAKAISTPRSTVRSILDKLCSKGVVGKVYKQNTQYYFCLPTEALVTSVERDIELQQTKLSTIRQAAPLFSDVRGGKSLLPKVQYFEGEKATIEAFNHALYQDVDEILYITSYAFAESDLAWKNDLEFFIPMRVKKGIRLRALCHRNQQGMRFFETSEEELREHRFLSCEFPLPGNIAIYGNFVLHWSTAKGECMAVLTESRIVAETMRGVFESAWSTAKK